MKLSVIGVTPQKEKQFNSKGIYSAEDLVRVLPRKYNDCSHVTGILPEDQLSCIIVKLNRVQAYSNGTPMLMAFCQTEDGKSVLVRWFRQNYLASKISGYIGYKIFLCAKLAYDAKYDNYSTTAPELFEPKISEGMRIIPVYPKIPGMSVEYLADRMSEAVSYPETCGETLPPAMVADEHLLPMREALYSVHFPKTMGQVEKAQERMLLDDLVYFALNTAYAEQESSMKSPFMVTSESLPEQIRSSLPYKLTEDQNAAVRGMLQRVREGKRLNALVQGDVGCGKTIVAILMMAAFVSSGYQAAIMAPTQVLAKQHYADLKDMMEPLGKSVVYMGGSEMKVRERKAALAAIESGEADFIVGTTSIISKAVTYKSLALTVVDEEHKFGVAQRAALTAKAAEGVHSITMSATPIPRTLATVVYGSAIDLYTIQTMPEGRQPVITGIATDEERIFRFILSQTKKGQQSYVVCPMIDTGEDDNGVLSVEEVSRKYRMALGPHGVRIATLTGRDSKAKAEETIGLFKDGEIDVLISTTVIEVGVNVPNATTMVITNAERFGLSSLHQLRGRVGRGKLQSYCVLQSDCPTDKAEQRLGAMVRTTNGFEIAEEDLKLRGAGEFLGTRQSGDNKYMTLILAYPDKYKYAQTLADKILKGNMKCSMLNRVTEERESGVAECQ